MGQAITCLVAMISNDTDQLQTVKSEFKYIIIF